MLYCFARGKVLTVKDDPYDNITLECATAANADVIVSGDFHLLHIHQWRDIQIRLTLRFL